MSYEDDVAAGWLTTQTDAPFHKLVVKVAKENTYSIIADPLLQHIPWDLRVPGIWHCMHNCRTAMWILLKDAANKYGAACREGLKRAMGKLGLGKIKVAATNRPKKLGPGFENSSHIEYLILHEQSEPDRVKAVEAEVKNEGCERTAMDGQELEKVMKNIGAVLKGMEEGVGAANKERFADFKTAMHSALTSFNLGAEVALADIWLTDRSHEMGQHFRAWINVIIDDMGPQIGLPYHGRSYIDILPAHYVHEPDHLEAHSSSTWQKYGVAPGSGTDATMEMVKTCFVASCLTACAPLEKTLLGANLNVAPAGKPKHEKVFNFRERELCRRADFEHN